MTVTILRALAGLGALVWAAVGIAATVALSRAVRFVQDPDGPPLDLRDALYVADILRAAEVDR